MCKQVSMFLLHMCKGFSHLKGEAIMTSLDDVTVILLI